MHIDMLKFQAQINQFILGNYERLLYSKDNG